MARSLPLPNPFDFAQFDQLARVAHRVLMLDYDGTLAPFRPERMEAFPYPGVVEALRDLTAARHTRVVIVSGRRLVELYELLGTDLGVEMWGTHGWERLTAGGRAEQWQPAPEVADVLRCAAEGARAHVPPGAVEVKAASVAVHTRALTDDERSQVSNMVDTHWAPLADHDAIDLRVFDGGYELRAAGRTKGDVVTTLYDEIRDQRVPSSLFAYLGDDDTDEDAFAALGADDWPILIRAEPRPSHARFWLSPPGDLLRFIHTWTLTGC